MQLHLELLAISLATRRKGEAGQKGDIREQTEYPEEMKKRIKEEGIRYIHDVLENKIYCQEYTETNQRCRKQFATCRNIKEQKRRAK